MTQHTPFGIFDFAADMCREVYGLKNAPGMSDEDIAREYKAQHIFYSALSKFRSAVQDAMLLTDVRHDALADLLAGLDDSTPSRDQWDEQIRTESGE